MNKGYDLPRIAAELQDDLDKLIQSIYHANDSPGGFMSGPFETRWATTYYLAKELEEKLRGLNGGQK